MEVGGGETEDCLFYFPHRPRACTLHALRCLCSEIRGQLAVLMGGRAAEQLTCEALSTGAVDDIRRATDVAQRAVAVSWVADGSWAAVAVFLVCLTFLPCPSPRALPPPPPHPHPHHRNSV